MARIPESATRPGAEERTRTSPLSLILGYGAMLPIAAGAAAAAASPGVWGALAARLAVLWACAILLFLSGVRRGLSFRTAGGPTAMQITTMLCLFPLGFAALLIETLLPLWSRSAVSVLILGYVLLLVLDPIAASRGEVPPFFARLRPFQMLIPIISLLGLFYLKSRAG